MGLGEPTGAAGRWGEDVGGGVVETASCCEEGGAGDIVHTAALKENVESEGEGVAARAGAAGGAGGSTAGAA